MNRSHEELQSLLGAYAVHAIDDDAERTAVAAHIETCDICAIELVHLQEAASLLGASEPIENDSLWERIESQLEPEPRAPRMRIISGPWAAKWAKPAVGAIAAALVLVIGISALTMNRMDNGYSPEAQAQAAKAALTADGARKATLTGDDGKTVTAVVLPDGHGYLINDNMGAASEGRSYQLWALVEGTPISAGVLGPSFKVANFTVNTDVSGFAISEEVKTGSTSPNMAVMTGTLPA